MFQDSSGQISSVGYSLVSMETDGSPDTSSPLAEFLQARIERVVQGLATGASTPDLTPSRKALERFLVALDELAAAAESLAAKVPTQQSRDLIVLVAGDEAFTQQIRDAGVETLEIAAVDPEERSVLSALERRPSLVVANGARGAAALQRLRKLQPRLPALLVASDAEAARLADQFAAEPVIVLREPGAGELGLAIRALVAAPGNAAVSLAPSGLLMEPRSYAHLAGLLPRALERTVQFDVGAAVISRPENEPLVDVYAGSDSSQETVEWVRARAIALFRIVCGGAHAEEQALSAERPHSHLQSSMYVPLASEGRVVGLTYLAAFRPDAFSLEDERVLSELASHASGAYRRLEASVHRLRLSPRQSQVLALIASGLSDKEVASRLGLAHRTVRTHVDRMLREHGLRSRTEAVTAWLRGQQD
jgi:DNA-binding NarL/FixJ family response regulator